MIDLSFQMHNMNPHFTNEKDVFTFLGDIAGNDKDDHTHYLDGNKYTFKVRPGIQKSRRCFVATAGFEDVPLLTGTKLYLYKQFCRGTLAKKQ